MEYKLISIIVPVYNVEPYLRRCVDSITCQTYRNLEIILVDDGSPDGCPAICDEYASMDARIRVIHKENGGLSSARNAGLDAANGAYVGFIDSDDYIHPRYCELLYKAFLGSEADIAIADYLQTDKLDEVFEDNLSVDTSIRVESDIDINAAMYVLAWGKLYKNSLLRNIRFVESIPFSEDRIFNFCIYGAFPNLKMVYVPAKLYYYVQRPGSITHNASYVAQFKEVELLDEQSAKIIDSYAKRRLFEKAFKQALCVRYFSSVENDKLYIKRANVFLKAHLVELIFTPGIPIKQRLALSAFVAFPWIYRRYLIHIDPTYLQYEERLRESRNQHK